jgi:ABC-type cobalamin/Fe3+-siderophores transport system ATPase subunit
MKNGNIVASGETKEVITAENLEKVYEIEFALVKRPDGRGSYFIPR